LEVVNNNLLSRFEIFLDGQIAGFAEYKIEGHTIKFPHTEVDPAFGGKGVGRALVEFALNDAKKQGKFVAPICPFVARAIAKNPENYLELVPESERTKYKLT
jgi:predicted GNAT family acetyltransferase